MRQTTEELVIEGCTLDAVDACVGGSEFCNGHPVRGKRAEFTAIVSVAAVERPRSFRNSMMSGASAKAAFSVGGSLLSLRLHSQ